MFFYRFVFLITKIVKHLDEFKCFPMNFKMRSPTFIFSNMSFFPPLYLTRYVNILQKNVYIISQTEKESNIRPNKT